MDSFLEFFNTMPPLYKLAWVILCLVLFWLAESSRPLFNLNYSKWKHAYVNVAFLLMILLINAGFGLAFFAIDDWSQQQGFGLMFLISLPQWSELLIAFLFFDLVSQYYVHYLMHKYKPLWKLHLIHHSDTKVDATTGTRQHPGEFILRESFAVVVNLALGAPVAYYLFYRVCTIFFTYFTHSNISLPSWLDKYLAYIIVTPNMHKFHHHFERPWTDTNYGNIFSIWDRIFGTLVYDDIAKIRYGLDVLDDNKDEEIGYLLGLPWNKNVKTDY